MAGGKNRNSKTGNYCSGDKKADGNAHRGNRERSFKNAGQRFDGGRGNGGSGRNRQGGYGRVRRQPNPNNDQHNWPNDHPDNDSSQSFRKFWDREDRPPPNNPSNFNSNQAWYPEHYYQGNLNQVNDAEVGISQERPQQVNLNASPVKETTECKDQLTSAQKPKSLRVKPESKKSSDDEENKSQASNISKPQATAIHIKKEPASPPPKKKVVESSSSTSSSSDDSDAPTQSKSGEIKLRKERTPAAEVVCLGKVKNIQNLVNDDDITTVCLVCKKKGHAADKCQVKCTRCSQCSYEPCFMCKSCGEVYSKSLKSSVGTQNSFIMFMQFMQFCMNQFLELNMNVNQGVPEPVVVPNNESIAEEVRSDLDSKPQKKKKKKVAESKKRRRKETSEDSDASSTTSTDTEAEKKKKKRLKLSKTSNTPTVSTPSANMGAMPTSLPFPGGFVSGYNSLLSLNNLMRYNATPVNFPK